MAARREHIAAFARRVVQAEDHVGQRVHVEEVVLARQLDAPAADRAQELERQIALVAEIELEQAAVVLPARRRDRLPRADTA